MIDPGATRWTRTGLPVVVRVLLPLLGIFFLTYPVMTLLASDPNPAEVFLVLGAVALFMGVFLWLMGTREPLQLVPAGPHILFLYRATIVFLAVVACILGFFVGAEWRMLFFYHLNVAAGIMLPKREAYGAVAAIALLTLVAGASTGFAWLAVPAAAIGLWSIAFVSQVAAVSQLRTTRMELTRLAVSEERLRFARDLHDLLGHSLSLIVLKGELAGRLLPVAPENDPTAAELRDLQGVARGALREVREAVSGYRQPSVTAELAGAREMLEAAGISCRVRSDTGPIPPGSEEILAWAVREGVTNVVRHSRARGCEIRLTREGETLRLAVLDDGPARPGHAGEGPGGSGLRGLAERVAVSGGECAAGPLPEGGFGLRVRLPVGAATDGGDTVGSTPAAGGASPADAGGRG